jgi:hypothetical protein
MNLSILWRSMVNHSRRIVKRKDEKYVYATCKTGKAWGDISCSVVVLPGRLTTMKHSTSNQGNQEPARRTSLYPWHGPPACCPNTSTQKARNQPRRPASICSLLLQLCKCSTGKQHRRRTAHFDPLSCFRNAGLERGVTAMQLMNCATHHEKNAMQQVDVLFSSLHPVL